MRSHQRWPRNATAGETTFFPASPKLLGGHPPEPIESACRTTPRALECSQYNTTYGTARWGIEHDEWMMVDELIHPNHTVIEFGARYGTTSCRLARATGNSGLVLGVEPQHTSCVRFDLLRNVLRNGCAVHLVAGGTVGDRSLTLLGADPGDRRGYSMRTSNDNVDEYASARMDDSTLHREKKKRVSTKSALPNWRHPDLEVRVGSRFNAALVDCEGCIRHALSGGLLKQLDLILIEEDGVPEQPPPLPMPTPADIAAYTQARNATAGHRAYAGWRAYLAAQGFVQIWRSEDTLGRARWSSQIAHAAWQRVGTGSPVRDRCREAVERTRLPRSLLRCAPYSKQKLWWWA